MANSSDDVVGQVIAGGKPVMAGAWEAFARLVIHPSAGPMQVAEMKKAFYAGAMTIMSLNDKLGEESTTEEQAVALLQQTWNELMAFAISLPDNGKGGPTNETIITKEH